MRQCYFAIGATAFFIFILLFFALFSQLIRPVNIVVAFPNEKRLFFLQNESFVNTGIANIVDICTFKGKLLLFTREGKIYHNGVPIYNVRTGIEWAAVKRDTELYVGSDKGIYKIPGQLKQHWTLPIGTHAVAWHNDEWVTRNTSFEYFPRNNRKLIELTENGFILEKGVDDERILSRQWIGLGARGIAFLF